MKDVLAKIEEDMRAITSAHVQQDATRIALQELAYARKLILEGNLVELQVDSYRHELFPVSEIREKPDLSGWLAEDFCRSVCEVEKAPDDPMTAMEAIALGKTKRPDEEVAEVFEEVRQAYTAQAKAEAESGLQEALLLQIKLNKDLDRIRENRGNYLGEWWVHEHEGGGFFLRWLRREEEEEARKSVLENRFPWTTMMGAMKQRPGV